MKPDTIIYGGLAGIIGTAAKELIDYISYSYGIALLYLIRLTGKDYLYLKGMGLGWFIWLTLFGIIVNLHVIRITPTDIGTVSPIIH